MAAGSVARTAPALAGACAALLLAACSSGGAGPGPCDGVSEKSFGITRDDYRPCAAAMIAALDSLARPLGEFVRTGDGEARARAGAHYRRLRSLMRGVGFQGDASREAREGRDRTIQRWPEGAMRAFNREVIAASAQYGSALRYPDPGNLQEGRRHHDLAKQAHGRFR